MLLNGICYFHPYMETYMLSHGEKEVLHAVRQAECEFE